MKCPNTQCQNDKVQPGDRFCGVCGHAIQQSAPTPAPAAPTSLPQPIPTVEVDFKTAVHGGTVQASLPVPDAPGQSQNRLVNVQIPKNTPEGTLLTLKASGHAGGALRVSVLFREHPIWGHNRHGQAKGDVFMVAPVSVALARNGGPLEVPVIDGAARVTVPPNSSGETILRLPGAGLPRSQGAGQRGDFHISLVLSDAAAQHYAKWGMEALVLLAQWGTPAAEQCIEKGWSPDEWRKNLDRCQPVIDGFFVRLPGEKR